MGKFLFLILGGIAIYLLYRRAKGGGKLFYSKREGGNGNSPSSHASKRGEMGESLEEFVECERCHTFVPAGEIRKIEGKNVCRGCYENS
jgi:hypothetical protein